MRGIGIEALRPTEPRRGEGHPAPATGKTKVENLINVLHRPVEIAWKSGHSGARRWRSKPD